jgi:sugar lactone lactonase YvrE
MTALAKAPADRYPDAAAFGRALADAAAAAYGPDWLALTGLIVRLQEPADGQLWRANPDSGGNVFTPATVHLDVAPAHVAPPVPPDAATDRYVPTADPSQAGSAGPTDVSTGLPAATAGGGAGAGADSPGPAPAKDGPAEDTHPFAGTQFGYNRFGWRRLLRRRAVLAAAATLAALALAVTAVVLVAASGQGGTGAAAGVTPSTSTQAHATASITQFAIPGSFSGWATGPDGILYFSDSTSNRVLRRDGLGKVTLVAGTGYAGTNGDGGPAIDAALSYPTGLALDGGGNLYILEQEHGRIRRINPHGDITTVAGGGDMSDLSTTGPIPATSTSFVPEGHMAVDTNGDIYFADTSTVYKVDAEQRLTRIARIGKPGDLGAGLPQLTNDDLAGLAVHDGRLYAAADNNVINVLDKDGTVTTVAGTGQKGFSGDGGLATAARLDLPLTSAVSAIALDATGNNLYIEDSDSHRVRLVSHGIISTVAGNGDEGAFTEGQLAVHQPLYGPDKIAVADDGTLLIQNSTAIVRVDGRGNLTTVQDL